MSRRPPPKLLKLLQGVKAKRPKTVIDHIVKHGQVTTEELKEIYGYNHPPRAARDVRELGIPIVTFRVVGADGRKMAAYKFGDPAEARAARLLGRSAFASNIKQTLIKKFGERCNIYLEPFPPRELQIDHRIPFEIAGGNSNNADDYMLLCASANRAKSWSCENCSNWKDKKPSACKTCYWAYPESYKHIAMRNIRRLDLLWAGKQTKEYEALVGEATKAGKKTPEYVKSILRQRLKKKSTKTK